MQELIIVLIFAVALGYLGRRAYRSFSKKEAGCGKGCGCAADSDAIKRPMKQKLQF
ncbi:FeoB-associated Cys-rich membrane protein [Spirosoma utsteinense]|nr:FeoB-associated Cys-rich membrane protein [Spirosoma utsteinense]